MTRHFDNYESFVNTVLAVFPDAVFDEDGNHELFISTGMGEAPNGEIVPHQEARELWRNKGKD